MTVHDLEAFVDVDHDRNVLDTFDHESAGWCDLQQAVIKGARQDVWEHVDLQHGVVRG